MSERGQVDGMVLVVLLAGTLAFYAGVFAWRGLEWTGHHIKCGIVRVFTGERCAPKPAKPLPANPLEAIEIE